MRIILAAAAALAVFTVAGCDINTGPAKTAKVDCNCTVPLPAATTPPPAMRGATDETPPARHAHWHHHAWRYAGGGHSYYWRREYAEVSVATYDYHSDSHAYYQGYEGGGAYVGGSVHGDGYSRTAGGWIDGYGRGHDGGATAGEPVHYETGGDDHGRMHPWRGYDADCPDNDPHHH